MCIVKILGPSFLENGLQVIQAGESQADVGRSPLKTILNKREKIKRTSQSTASLVAMNVSHTRSKLLEMMESHLSIWVEDQSRCAVGAWQLW